MNQKNKYFNIILLLVIVLLLYSPVNANAIIIGSEYFGIRQWVLMRNDEPIKTIEGRLLKLKYYVCTGCDHDMNVYVDPDPGYEYISVNRHGATNGPMEDGEIPAGSIEAEVGTIRNLIDDYFRPGMKVLVNGWWVEDTGHDHKTEIHPIRYMISEWTSQRPGEGSNFSIFISQDITGRFKDYVTEDFFQTFHVSLSSEKDLLRPDLNEQGGNSNGGALIEKSGLDFFNKDTSPARSYYEAILFQYPNPPELRLGVRLYRPVTMFFYIPFYFGNFQRLVKPVFRDNVNYEIETDAQGKKSVKITIDASLLENVFDSPIKYSKWIWTDDANQLQTQYKDSGPHSIQYVARYSPSLGKHNTEWTLSVIGSNRYSMELPNAIAQGLNERWYTQKERAYKIEPSSLILHYKERSHETPRDRTREGMSLTDTIDCKSNNVLIAKEKLLPQVQFKPGTFKWHARAVRNTGGRNVAPGSLIGAYPIAPPYPLPTDGSMASYIQQFLWKEITTAEPFENESVKLTIDPDDDHRLNIEWKNPESGLNFSKISVKVSGVTEIGENLIDVADIGPIACVQNGSLDQYFENIYKGLIAVQYLRDIGLWEETPTLPDRLSDVFGRNLKVDFVSLGEPYKIHKRLPKNVVKVWSVFRKLLDGDVLSKKDQAFLSNFANASRMIQWITPPPKDLFKYMALSSQFKPVGRPMDYISEKPIPQMKSKDVMLPFRDKIK